MRRAKNPLWILLLVFFAGVGFTLLTVWAVRPIEGDIEYNELVPKFMGSIPFPDCWHLYNNGNHREWADCMGVGYN